MAKIKRVALVTCRGGAARRTDEELTGLDCRRAMEKIPGGPLVCEQGCLGLGSCVAACRRDAIRIGRNGAAVVDREKCVGCGLCVKACPRGRIRLIPAELVISPRCGTGLPAAQVRKSCGSGCISCRICEKSCPVEAITVENGHAVIDEARCISCGMCAVKCPRGVIVDADGIFTEIPE